MLQRQIKAPGKLGLEIRVADLVGGCGGIGAADRVSTGNAGQGAEIIECRCAIAAGKGQSKLILAFRVKAPNAVEERAQYLIVVGEPTAGAVAMGMQAFPAQSAVDHSS